MKPILTIAIPTVEGRKIQFELLYQHINNQIKEYGFRKEVEIIYESDNKEISIGAKRNKLIDRAEGKYLVMIDDDDWVPYNYVSTVLTAAKEDADCIGYLEDCSWENGAKKISCFSLKYAEWSENKTSHPEYDHVRSPFFKNPIKTSICRLVGCADMRFGEDHDFSKRIYPLLKTEAFIPERLYYYRHRNEMHNIKYGIK